MKIVVLVKEVPDTYGDREIVLETGLVDRVASNPVLDEIGERALEAALVIQGKAPGTTVTVLSMGPTHAVDSLRKALAMGANDAIHVVDDALVGADLSLTAEVLAETIRRQGADLILTGNLSTDGSGGVMAAMLAEHLGLAQATNLATLEVEGSTVHGQRTADGGTMSVEAGLPAVVSITEAMPDPRFPSFKGIMGAKKKPILTVTTRELGIDTADRSVASAIVLAASSRPARAGGTTITDEGDGAARLAEFLLEQKLV